MVAELLALITELRADIRASIFAFESLQQLPSTPPALDQAKGPGRAHLPQSLP
jgi:hypothetical protein